MTCIQVITSDLEDNQVKADNEESDEEMEIVLMSQPKSFPYVENNKVWPSPLPTQSQLKATTICMTNERCLSKKRKRSRIF